MRKKVSLLGILFVLAAVCLVVGICLMFEPEKTFEPGGKPKSMMAYARKRLKAIRQLF